MAAMPSPAHRRRKPAVAARQLARFTVSELADFAGVSRTTAAGKVEAMLEVGEARDTGERRKHGGPGRPAPVYVYVERKPEKLARRDWRPPVVEDDVVKCLRPRAPKATSRRKKRITNSDVRALVADCVALGCRWEWTKGGHIWIIPPGNTTGRVLIPSTPSDSHAIPNSRAEIRRAGVAL
jgi:hypothetical protein